jgi:hypothetical protein
VLLCVVVREEESCRRRSSRISYKLSCDDLAAEASYYISSVQTFEEVTVLTEDRGLVVTMSHGSEYKLLSLRAGELERTRGGL